MRDSGLPFGVVHAYDPCVPAERQAANFVTIVPRDDTLLPPAIALERPATECNDPVSEAGVESELTTFLNEVEGHVGKPAVLKLAPGFEERYHVAARIERNLWLERDWLEPAYAGRPWTLWTANSSLRTAASDTPPLYEDSNAWNCRNSSAVTPLNNLISAAWPVPGAVITSSRPSPLTSAAAMTAPEI